MKTKGKKNATLTNNPMPQSVADSIPYKYVYENGIIEVETGRFSKSYFLPEVNFKTVDANRQASIAEQYSQFISSFDSSVTIEITLYNKTINIEEFQKNVFIEMKSDNLNEYRDEYNKMLQEKMVGAKNNLITEKYLTRDFSRLILMLLTQWQQSLKCQCNL